MAAVTKTKTWADNENVLYTDINANFDILYNLVNGSIDNANIATGAGIDPAKIANTAATLAGTENLSNKTLIKPLVNGSKQAVTTGVDAATVTFDMAQSNVHKLVMAGNRTLAVANVATGQAFFVILEPQGNTPTWWNNILWVDATAPVVTPTANRYDIFSFFYDGTNYFGSIVGQNYG